MLVFEKLEAMPLHFIGHRQDQSYSYHNRRFCPRVGILALPSASLNMICDSLKAHRSRLVREYLDGLGGHIQIAFLPPYAPNMNPVVYLWARFKRHALANYCPNDLDELHTTTLQRNHPTWRNHLNACLIVRTQPTTTGRGRVGVTIDVDDLSNALRHGLAQPDGGAWLPHRVEL